MLGETLRPYFESKLPEALQLLRHMVEINSFTANTEGVNRLGKLTAEAFAPLGFAAEFVPSAEPAWGNHLVLTRPGRSDQSIAMVSHLDTVFPLDTPIRIRREHGRVHAPGISDNCRGLAALLAIARALLHAGVRPAAPVVFAANVGEEGVGDLRGVKHLFREGSPWRDIRAFISVDGTGLRRIVTRGVGSRRFRATVEGPGGHSWADWGAPNPVNALGLGIAELARISPPKQPRTVLTVGRIAGGTSVNAIPDSAWLELDLRSEAGAPLHDLEARVRRIFAQATAEANSRRRRGTAALSLDMQLIGDRPTGETALTADIVRAARAATRAVGETPEMVSSSTDANIAMALGIPAIALGAGGEAGGTHTLEEWYSNDKGPEGIERVMLTVLGITGLA